MSPCSPHAPAIEIADLHKTFGDVHAVNGLSLTVNPGEVVAFLGPNGAGKSTTIDVILGLSQPTSGTVRVFGHSPAQAIASGTIGASLQDASLLTDVTVSQTLDIMASLQAHTPSLDSIIDRTHLRSLLRRRVSKLSGGERQRLRLAIALLPHPELLILDEPTTGMDVSARANFWASMREDTLTHKRTLVFATHYLAEAADYADRIIIIHHGHLVADGTINDLRATAPAATITATWEGATAEEVRTLLAPISDVADLTVHGNHVKIRAGSSDDVARLLLSRDGVRNIGIEPASLDDIFSYLITDET